MLSFSILFVYLPQKKKKNMSTPDLAGLHTKLVDRVFLASQWEAGLFHSADHSSDATALQVGRATLIESLHNQCD